MPTVGVMGGLGSPQSGSTAGAVLHRPLLAQELWSVAILSSTPPVPVTGSSSYSPFPLACALGLRQALGGLRTGDCSPCPSAFVSLPGSALGR